jgi:AcrR family transcriptional regulator
VRQRPRRPYLQRRRAERTGETRARILDAVIALHEELGPSRTTVSAIAARAGVQRLTVYRHFPDDRGRLEASTSRWLSAHPPPAPALWSEETDPAAATESALVRMFAYYRRTARMWTAVYRDLAQVPELGLSMASFEEQLTSIGDGLVRAWSGELGSPEGRALIRHALRFSTWESLAREDLDDEQMARLFVDWLTAAAAGRRSGAV